MTLRGLDILEKIEYYRSLQYEAEQARLWRQAQTASSHNLIHHMLTGLGRFLVKIGTYLQKRYCDCNLNASMDIAAATSHK